MLELLDLAPGQSVLDVGSGSGWSTSLLAHVVGPHGHVVEGEMLRVLRRSRPLPPRVTRHGRYWFVPLR